MKYWSRIQQPVRNLIVKLFAKKKNVQLFAYQFLNKFAITLYNKRNDKKYKSKKQEKKNQSKIKTL